MRHLVLPAVLSLVSSTVAANAAMLAGSPPFDVDHPMLHAWYEAGEGVNTDTPSDGDAVVTWLDLSGHNRNLVQVDENPDRHATWHVDSLEENPAVSFDGNDYIWCEPNSTWGTLGGDKTFFVAVRCNVADGGYVFDSYAGAARNAFFAGQSSNPQEWCLYDGSSVLGSSVVAAGAVRVHTVEFSDAGMKHRIGGELIAEGPSANGPMTGIMVGSRYNLTFGLNGEIGTLLVFNGILPDVERAGIEDWLNGRYPATEVPEQPAFIDVFTNGEGGWPQYRIPSLLTTQDGTLLAFSEGRLNIGDNAQNDIVMRRSMDGGFTWGDHVLLDDAGGNCANNPTLVQSRCGLSAGRIIMMYLTIPDGCHLGCVEPGYDGDNIIRIMKMHSDDDGLSWSQPVDVTSGCKRETTADVMIGPGLGIEMRRWPFEGRLVMPMAERINGHWYAYAAWSDDHGNTWQYGQNIDDSQVAGMMNEDQLVELTDGRLLMNSRHYGGDPNRLESHSSNGGATWSPAYVSQLPGTACMASIIRLADPLDGFTTPRLLYSGHADSGRDEGTIWVSYDEGVSWGNGRLLEPGSFAYNVSQVIDCNTIGSLYETANYGRIRLGLFSLAWQSENADTLEGEDPCIACPTDIDGDGVVGVDELLAVIAAWGTDDTDTDINDDGIVDTNDILLVLSAWGPCP